MGCCPSPSWIPEEQTEALRDLERARDDARLAERRAKQQLLKFLLRQDRRFVDGKEHWTKTHWAWIRRQKFHHEARRRLLADAIGTIEQAQVRVARLDQDIAECLDGWALAPLVKHLQAFRGVARLTAVGLVPSESSSGQSRHQGGLTRTGNRHLRRLLVEAAWQYDRAPAQASAALVKRREGGPEGVVSIAEQALRRRSPPPWRGSWRALCGPPPA